jgi:hypothetical protein
LRGGRGLLVGWQTKRVYLTGFHFPSLSPSPLLIKKAIAPFLADDKTITVRGYQKKTTKTRDDGHRDYSSAPNRIITFACRQETLAAAAGSSRQRKNAGKSFPRQSTTTWNKQKNGHSHTRTAV